MASSRDITEWTVVIEADRTAEARHLWAAHISSQRCDHDGWPTRSPRGAFPRPEPQRALAVSAPSAAARPWRRPDRAYVHGGTFPSGLSIAHRFDGRSWRDELCAAGFHVWA